MTRVTNNSHMARKRTPNSLRQSGVRLRRLAESNVIGVAVADLKGRIIDANDTFLNFIGFSRQELASGTMRWDSLTPPEYLDLDRRAVDQLRRTGIALPWEKEFLHKRGDRISVMIGVATIDGTGGDIECVSFVLDISERKRLERQLYLAKVAAEAVNQAKHQFLANKSHELRTQLNGIIGMTDLALQTQLTSEQLEYLETVKASSGSLLTLINDILDFSTMDAGKLELKICEFNLRDCLESVLRTLAVLAEEKGLKFLYEVAADVPEIVYGDPARLRQILINLVGNAIKFTNKGEVAIKVRTAPEESFLHFTVSDSGIGIPKDKLQSILAPFTQADNSSTRKFGGTGLGLTLSAWLAATMGGSLWVDSQVGHGSHFHFTIQLKTAAAKEGGLQG
jgi:PAS domain S-box-containing protein